ncbi:alpha/beta hydrolase [Gaetbulibacter sp. M240]|uniref:alpha/beta hydrolase n=1 Tax=Gaetbulibacter sp. M240 TaxID=3126511 RepID=UPI00374F7999
MKKSLPLLYESGMNVIKNNILKLILLGFIFCNTVCLGQSPMLYKNIDSTKLYLEVIYPKKMDSLKKYPAMIFFFGGGWMTGNKSQFRNQANYLAQRGIVCFLADYRTRNDNHTTPFESVKDAKSAVRFIRKNATKFQIDPLKIIASGGSAGGHLAAATALIDDFNEVSDDLSISCVPNALVLFNPVIDNGPGGYGYDRIGEEYKEFSPLHNIEKDAPPTIIFIGNQDKLIPVITVQYYQMIMRKVGSVCELKIYDGLGHGFFNYNNSKRGYMETLSETDRFLQSLGLIEEKTNIQIPIPN